MTAAFIQQRMSPEELVRTVLETGLTVSAAELARRCGVSREAVRQIRYGRLHAKVLPDLPRPGRGHGSRRCWHCRLAVSNQRPNHRRAHRDQDEAPWCSLGIPESTSPTYARECPAFEPIE